MKKTFFLSAFLCAIFTTLVAQSNSGQNQTPVQNGIQTPGLDVLGYGYDIFGNYADQKSKKRYCLFKYFNFTNTPIGSYQYSVPQYVFLENISNHITKTVSGESIRDYVRSLSAEVGLSGETMFFKGSINSTYSQSISGSQQRFYYTYMDANTKWRISFDERDLGYLKNILDPRFKQDLEKMDPKQLFELYGTHYIASAYLGGRADFSSESVTSNQTSTRDISVAVEASYKAVSGNAKLNTSESQTLHNAQTTTRLTVVGGNSQYANNISNWDAYKLWADGIESMPVLCDFDKYSLRPIWEFCESPARKNELEAAFKKLCAENPLPEAMASLIKVTNSAYMVKNKATNKYFDFSGVNPQDPKPGDKLLLYGLENNTIKGQGFDRIYKFVNSETDPTLVYIQPQHTNLVLDITGGKFAPGNQIQIWKRTNGNVSQLFSLVPVDGEPNTYYIKTSSGDLCIASAGSNVILDVFNKSDNQKWIFETFDLRNIIQPNGYYAVKCVAGGNFWDFPGTYPYIRSNKLQLWSPGNAIGDRTVNISRKGDYFVIRPNYSADNVLTAESNKQIQNKKKNTADDQLFYFEYAGQPNSYFIVSKILNNGSKQVIDANAQETMKQGCAVSMWNFTGAENQRWILIPLRPQKPLFEGEYIVKVADSNKYWDLAGDDQVSNKNGAKAQIWDLDGGRDRKVRFIPSEETEYYYIEFQNGGKRLNIDGPWNITSMSYVDQAKYRSGQSDIKLKKDKGAKLEAYNPLPLNDHNADCQKFKIQYLGNGIFTFISKISDRAIDVQGGKINDNGARLHLWDANSNIASQKFQIIDASNNQPYKAE
ncbi:MAG: RICIN domain-containing protein [Paludibacter sp.]|nr:RICIN domain-containing protein [Paludibacter sp.]